MFMGIDRDAWISIWAGALGAIPAAVISAAVAAWVAVRVLNRSNLQQQRLAARAVAHEKKRAAVAALLQEDLAEKASSMQQRLAEQQLAEQRAEATRGREQAAIAEVIIAVERFPAEVLKSMDDVRHMQSRLESAVARWRVEIGRGEMQGELLAWTTLLFGAAIMRLRHIGESTLRERSWEVLRDATASFSTLALGWATSEGEARTSLKDWSMDARAKIEASLAGMKPVPDGS